MHFHEALTSRQTGWWIFGILVVLALDRWAKWIAVTQWSMRPVQILPGVSLEFFLNPGVALSIPVPNEVLALGTLVMFTILAVWLRHRTPTFATWIALAAVVFGALNNIVDRFQYHGVVDYLRVVIPTVLNLSDLVIVAGLVVLAMQRGKNPAQAKEE